MLQSRQFALFRKRSEFCDFQPILLQWEQTLVYRCDHARSTFLRDCENSSNASKYRFSTTLRAVAIHRLVIAALLLRVKVFYNRKKRLCAEENAWMFSMHSNNFCLFYGRIPSSRCRREIRETKTLKCIQKPSFSGFSAPITTTNSFEQFFILFGKLVLDSCALC